MICQIRKFIRKFSLSDISKFEKIYEKILFLNLPSWWWEDFWNFPDNLGELLILALKRAPYHHTYRDIYLYYNWDSKKMIFKNIAFDLRARSKKNISII